MVNPINKTKGNKARARIRTTLSRLTTLKPPFLDKIEQDSKQATKAILFNKFRFKTPTSKDRIHIMVNPINKIKGIKAKDRIKTTITRCSTLKPPFLDKIVQDLTPMIANIFLSFNKALPSKRANKAVLTLNNNATRTKIPMCKGNKLIQTRISNSTSSSKIHYKVINSLQISQINKRLMVAPLNLVVRFMINKQRLLTILNASRCG